MQCVNINNLTILGLTRKVSEWSIGLISEARQRLHIRFMDLPIGSRFQLINSIMGAAIFTGKTMTKTSETEAQREDEIVLPRPDSMVEVVQCDTCV